MKDNGDPELLDKIFIISVYIFMVFLALCMIIAWNAIWWIKIIEWYETN